MSTHILVVDDNPINLKLTAEVLKYSGHAVACVGDAEAALRSIRAEMPALLLVDLQLPGIDGLTFVRMLKADPELKTLRVVAVSAHAMGSDIRGAMAAGCDGFITKPIDVEKFPRQVAAYLAPAPRSTP